VGQAIRDPQEEAHAIRARQRAIGRELRRLYDSIATEPVPDEMLDLVNRIEEHAAKKQDAKS
jgi:hypothetical protein